MFRLLMQRLERHRRRRNRLLALLLLLAAASAAYLFLGVEEAEPGTPYTVPAGWKSGYFDTPLYQGSVFVVETGPTDAPAVILVHGLGQNASGDWLKVIPALEDHYRVIALDLPGFGRSAGCKGAFTPTAYAQLLHEIRQRYGSDDTALVGHSMGGAVALRYAAEHPEALSKLLLVDVAGILERTAYVKQIADIPPLPEAAPPLLERAAATLENLSGAIIEWFNLAPDPLDLVRTLNAHFQRNRLNGSQIAIAMELLDEDFSSAIGRLSLRTYLFWGDKDRIAPMRTAQLLASRLKNATLITFPGVGHVPMTADSDAFNAVLLDALRGIPPYRPATPVSGEKRPLLLCRGEVGTTYGGRYGTVIVEDSKAVRFTGLEADRVVVRRSTVSFENLEVHGERTALDAERSVVMITGARLQGALALHASSSRIDMAGVSLTGSDAALRVTKKARLIFSVSDLHGPEYDGDVHGDFRLKRGGVFLPEP